MVAQHARTGIIDCDVFPYPCMNDEILRCHWCTWEFDILSGRSIFSPHRMRVEEGWVVLHIQRLPGEVGELGGGGYPDRDLASTPIPSARSASIQRNGCGSFQASTS